MFADNSENLDIPNCNMKQLNNLVPLYIVQGHKAMENMEFLYAETTLLFSHNHLIMEMATFIKCWQPAKTELYSKWTEKDNISYCFMLLIFWCNVTAVGA
jgi:hypothetical protein